MKMIYQDSDYKAILKNTLESRKKIDKRFNFQKLAQAMRIQKSYLSKVMGGYAELNSDQLHLACEYLNFSNKETEYLQLLLEQSRSSLKTRKDQFQKRIIQIQAEYQETKAHLSAKTITTQTEGIEDYYLDPLIQIVHVSLSISRYRKNPLLLAQDLEVPAFRVLDSVHKLEKMGIIEKKGETWAVLHSEIHLPRESSYYASWRNQIRLMTLQRLQNLTSDETTSFSVVFTSHEPTRKQIQNKFLDFLKEIEALVKDSPDENTYQLNFDLFHWAK